MNKAMNASQTPPLDSVPLQRLVGLPDGMHLQPVSPAEFETAQRIFARWMYEHPEVTQLVLRRQANEKGQL